MINNIRWNLIHFDQRLTPPLVVYHYNKGGVMVSGCLDAAVEMPSTHETTFVWALVEKHFNVAESMKAIGKLIMHDDVIKRKHLSIYE